jgi:hypothetical protein
MPAAINGNTQAIQPGERLVDGIRRFLETLGNQIKLRGSCN